MSNSENTKKSDRCIGRGIILMLIPLLFFGIASLAEYPNRDKLERYTGVVIAKDYFQGRFAGKTFQYTLDIKNESFNICMKDYFPEISSFKVGQKLTFLGYKNSGSLGKCEIQGMEIISGWKKIITYEQYLYINKKLDKRFANSSWFFFVFGIASIIYGSRIKRKGQ